MILKTPTRIISLIQCHRAGHAHCKKVEHKTRRGPVLDCIMHHVHGTRFIENFRQEPGAL